MRRGLSGAGPNGSGLLPSRADSFSLMLGHTARMWIVSLLANGMFGGDELDAAFHKLRNKSYLPCEPVEPGHDKSRL